MCIKLHREKFNFYKERDVKMKQKKQIVKIIAMILCIALLVGIGINRNMFKSEASEQETQTVFDEENLQEDSSTDNVISCEIIKISDTNYKTVTIKDDGTRIESIVDEMGITTYKYNADNELVSEEYMDLSNFLDDSYQDDIEDEDNIVDQEDEITRGKTKWNKTVKEHYSVKNPYWYKKGSNGKKIYLRIGCKAKYQIRYDLLNKSKKNDCKEYMTLINSCNKKVNIANAAAVGVGILASVAIGVIISLAEAGVAAFTAIAKLSGNALFAGASTGTIGTIVYNIFGAKEDYQKIKNVYVDIRTYGNAYK